MDGTTNRLIAELLESDPTSAPRAYIQQTRKVLWQAHRAGVGGYEIVSAYTSAIDHLILALFDGASRDYVERYPSLSYRCTLVAQGGYGRGELNPYSDVDLLFLHAWKITPFVEIVAERILYALWDSAIEVGHAIRSIAESVRLGNKDMKVKTAMIDSRFLCGDRQLFEDFEKAVYEPFSGASGDRFIRKKIEETRLRHEHYGASVYLSEPEIKEGEGGLRDIHTVLWVAKVKWKVKSLDELGDRGVLNAKDLSGLKDSRDFLLRVRNEVHFSSESHQDQLSFEQQEKVAAHLGYRDDENIKGVEAFMRAYYLHAAKINRITSLVLYRANGSPLINHRRGQPGGREIRPGIHFSKGVIFISRPEILTAHPENIITVFLDAQRLRAEINQDTCELLRDHVNLVGEDFRRSAPPNAVFLEILRGEGRVYKTLIDMHRCGVLDAFLPEFGRVLCMVQHDLYHIYTVDQHSLRAVQEFERLRAGEFREVLPLLTQLARDVDKIEVLLLSILFHDIGKGHGGNHSQIGSRTASEIALRLGLNVDDQAQLTFLVLQHLILSHTAYRRDIDDEEQVVDFAQSIGSVTNLKLLYLLTYADTRAVAPGVWNNWKASLLEDLYVRSLRVLEELEKGEFRKADSKSRVKRIQIRIERVLSNLVSAEKVRPLLDGMPDRYFLTTPEREMAFHFKLLEHYAGQPVLSSVRHFPEREYSELAVCAKDQPGLFSRITGAFASLGLDILSARINTRKDGLILDVFRISHLGRPEVLMEDGKWTRVQKTLEWVMTENVDIALLVAESGRPMLFRSRPSPKVPTVIQVDNGASEDFTIFEVYTQDRIGVLFSIAHALHQLGISIHLAKISTNVDQVADVFYVTAGEGRKIQDEEELERIRRTLYQSLVQNDERVAQPSH